MGDSRGLWECQGCGDPSLLQGVRKGEGSIPAEVG